MTPQPSDQSPLLTDLLCLGCGYNLRGLEPSGRCPECGLEIEATLGGNPISTADPGWRHTLTTGLLALLFCQAAAIFATATGMVLLALPVQPSIQYRSTQWFTPSGLLADELFWFVVAFFITVPEPRIREMGLIPSPRRWTRIVGAVLLVDYYFPYAGMITSPLIRYDGWMMIRYSLFAAGFLALLFHLRRLALRASDAWLATHIPIALGGNVVLAVFTVLEFVVPSIHIRPTRGDPMSKLLFCSFLVFQVYAFYVLMRLRGALMTISQSQA